MDMLSLIETKKRGGELTRDEIVFFAQGAAEKTIPDYQLSALLMAIRLKGMTDRETADLTLAMRDSGDIADLSGIPGIKVDKHSTGGVGDTTTLVLAPLVAACGAPVSKMSGRGLGHTGGTVDKMESIPGMRAVLGMEEFIAQVQKIGIAVTAQTGHLAPADKALYALRDVTGTVDSLPLIVSSIMSKKLASGADAIVLDVKTGTGALMSTLEDSLELARCMVQVGEAAGKPTVAYVTGMDQPLGTHVGNALEVKEAIDVLAGRTGGDLLDVCLELGAQMLVLSGVAADMEDGIRKLRSVLASGAGMRKLKEMIAAQGGDPAVCDDVTLLPQAAMIRRVACGTAGYVQGMNTVALGSAAQEMGAGRKKLGDALDYSVGFVLPVRIGDRVEPETELCTLYARNEEEAQRAEAAVRAAVRIGPEACRKPPVFFAKVTKDGIKDLRNA